MAPPIPPVPSPFSTGLAFPFPFISFFFCHPLFYSCDNFFFAAAITPIFTGLRGGFLCRFPVVSWW